MFLFHRRILSLPAPTGSLSFQSSRKGTPTHFLFPHLLIVALHASHHTGYVKVKTSDRRRLRSFLQFSPSRRAEEIAGIRSMPCCPVDFLMDFPLSRLAFRFRRF